MNCCRKNAIILIHGNKFCADHFINYYEKKFKKIIEKVKNKKIVLAISGGKDSMAMAYLFYKFYKTYDIYFELLFVDLGIKNYSEKCKEVVENFANSYNLKLNILNLKDELKTIDDIQKNRKKFKLKKPICSYCGLIKRYLINKFTYENNFDYAALGHNLDDELAFIFINSLSQDISQLFRRNKIIEKNEKFKLAGRIKPLYYSSEKENLVYCLVNNINFYNGECPYSFNSSQIKIKHLVNIFEDKNPSFKINFLKTFDKIKKIGIININDIKDNINNCNTCGFATTLDKCSYCRLKNLLK